MTREEAVEVLKERYLTCVGIGLDNHANRVNEAIDMAIEALSKPNYESDTELRLAVTNRKKDKVVLWDAFGEVEYYPNGEINCVNCPHYYETEDDTGVHSHCGSHGRLIDADALSKKLCETTIFIKDGELFQRMINDAPTVQADRPHGVWEYTEITTDNDTYSEWVCSECGGSGYELMCFCPWCGADMRKEKK